MLAFLEKGARESVCVCVCVCGGGVLEEAFHVLGISDASRKMWRVKVKRSHAH